MMRQFYSIQSITWRLAWLFSFVCLFGCATKPQPRLSKVGTEAQNRKSQQVIENLKNPKYSRVFGEIIFKLNGKVIPQPMTVYFKGMPSYPVYQDGSFLAALRPGLNTVEKIYLHRSGTEYPISSLGISAGPEKSQTYFGKITIEVQTPKKLTKQDPLIHWTWQVENNWNRSWVFWKKKFGPSFEQAYFRLAEKTGPINTSLQSRGIASDREDVVTGF